MSTPRNTPRGPAEATGIIAENAYKSAVMSSLVVPVLQIVLLKTASALQPLPATSSGPFTGEITAVFHSGMLALVLIPVASTIGSMILAYAFAGWLGIGLYWLMSITASAMLGASLTAATIFVIGMALFFMAAGVEMGVFSNGSRRGRRQF